MTNKNIYLILLLIGLIIKVDAQNEVSELFDAGFTYLLTPNFQLDISGGIGIN
ncbi:MAG: hypothetical protein K9G70_10005 [Prolixibacteraceae bacterium]|nr:hypothetical protein [Prolixibacteraceae bacterium]